jgi:hypothetical protein
MGGADTGMVNRSAAAARGICTLPTSTSTAADWMVLSILRGEMNPKP